MPYSLVDRGRSTVFQHDAPRSVASMHVADCGGQPIDGGVDILARFRGCRQQAGQIRRFADSIFPAFDPTGFSLDRGTPVVAVLGKLACLLQILFSLMVAHIHHDAVELASIGGAADHGGVLGMIEVEGYGHRRGACCIGARGYQAG